ncbi:MAG: 5-formyltetrahydrofolate cyclo-ligase, partial [Acetobacteraceae bacterium]|nr:5-formyltetrahydrofolate cyclo-ligase [Acetobacteraceae bacterium]
MAAPHFDLPAAKAAARAIVMSRRDACDPGVGAALARHVLTSIAIPPDAIIAGFWPMGREIDIRPLLDALLRR